MERDGIISHGAFKFLKESMTERSDKFKVVIDKTTGLISYTEDSYNQSQIEMPYSMKMLLQELNTMSIGARVQDDTKIDNVPVLTHLMESVRGKL